MDKVDRYRHIIQQVIEDSATLLSQGNQIAILPVCDHTHGQYLLISDGWHHSGREHDMVFHARLNGDKLFIEDDRAEESITGFLIEAGVDKNDIEFAWESRRRPENRSSRLPKNLEAIAA